jgi:hypothetical protein
LSAQRLSRRAFRKNPGQRTIEREAEMIKHIVLFKVREGITREDPRLLRAIDALRELEGRIGGIRSWEVGQNFSDRPIAADYALSSAFDSRDDLARYVDHPAHREVVGMLKEVCTWQVCDYPT